MKVGANQVSVGGSNYDAFVDGGKNSPAVVSGEPPGDAIKPYYMPPSWYYQPGSTMTNTWNSSTNSGSIVAYDQSGAVGAHSTDQFETSIVARNWLGTGQDLMLGSFRWGFANLGTTPNAGNPSATSVKLQNVSATSLNIISK